MAEQFKDEVKTVLVVDDELEIRNYIGRIAEICGWSCTGCATGQGVNSALQSDPSIALIVLDINMPDVDGIEAIIRLAENQQKDIPVCIITGGSEVYAGAAEKLASSNGIEIAAILQKPFVIEDMKRLFARY